MKFVSISILGALALAGCCTQPSEVAETVTKLPPDAEAGMIQPLLKPTYDGMSLIEALSLRSTTHKPGTCTLTDRQIGGLLWAANGQTRPDGKTTAPTARDKRELSLYLFDESSVWRYDPVAHALVLIHAYNALSVAGAGEAPAVIVITADLQKQSREYAMVDAGFIGQNIYLYCATERLGCVFRGTVNRQAVATELGLSPESVLFAVTIGAL